jgi:hypothetical protein
MRSLVLSRQQRLLLSSVCILGASVGWSRTAAAIDIDAGSDWQIRWDNTLTYNLGIRAEGIDPLIGNNPAEQNSDYKFPNFGSIVTNRLAVLSEFDAQHGTDYGFRISVGAWKDFAYDNTVATHPGDFLPGVPYTALSSEPSGHYASYTSKYYIQGGELEDAFVFKHFVIDDVPLDVKVGRFTEYWGNAYFAAFQSISYSQGPLDEIKASSSPGTPAKELFMPHGQISIRSPVSEEWTFGGQYSFEWRPDRFPEGGTFLGTDPFFVGPQSLDGTVQRGSDFNPHSLHDNFGLETIWAPEWLNGELGFYFREFDETAPFSSALLGVNSAGVPNYHLAYAQNVRLYGVTLDKTFEGVSTGIEASYRQGTALNSLTAVLNPADPTGREGAKGDTINFVANATYGLPTTSVFDTGSLLGEIAYTRVMAVTANPSLFDAVGYACSPHGINAGQGQADGCSTRDDLSATINFDPQWLQVFPGVDLDAPTTVGFGLVGNGQYLGTAANGNDQGAVFYTVGLNALIRQAYTVKLAYNGNSAPTHLINTVGQPFAQTGIGAFTFNDRNWISLTLQTSF